MEWLSTKFHILNRQPASQPAIHSCHLLISQKAVIDQNARSGSHPCAFNCVCVCSLMKCIRISFWNKWCAVSWWKIMMINNDIRKESAEAVGMRYMPSIWTYTVYSIRSHSGNYCWRQHWKRKRKRKKMIKQFKSKCGRGSRSNINNMIIMCVCDLRYSVPVLLSFLVKWFQ